MRLTALRLASFILLLAMGSALAGTKVGKDCTFGGKKLWGKVKFVHSGADLKVAIVKSFPDLKVQMVKSFPDSCGKWESVTSFPDLKVQIVTTFPDIKIQYVGSYPGVP